MIPAVFLLCLVAGAIALPVNTDYYPKSQGYGGHALNGGIIGINDNGFESSILGFNGGNSGAAAASAASGFNSAAAAAAAANAASRGFNNGFDAEFGFNGGNSAAASAAAAATGMNSAAAAAAAASSAQRSGFQGHSGHQLIGSNYGPFVQQVPSIQFPSVQQFNGFGGSAAAAAAAAAAGQQGAAAAAAAAAGQNAAAAAAAAAGRNAAAAAAAAASASGANFRHQVGIQGSQFAGQIGGQFIQPAVYYPNVPFVGQNSGAAAAAAAAASNNAAAAAAAASVSGSNGFNGGLIGRSTGVIGSRFVPGKKY